MKTYYLTKRGANLIVPLLVDKSSTSLLQAALCSKIRDIGVELRLFWGLQ